MTSTSTIHSNKKMFYHKTSFLFFIMCAFCINVVAQHTLHIIARSLPQAHKTDTVFIAGNFNGWNPGDSNYRLRKENDDLRIDITGLKKAVYEFKFTRGNWGKAEVTAEGKSIENHLVKLDSDTTVEYSIEGWADDFAQPGKTHTVSSQVQLLDTAFFIPQLYRSRKIWIYLPAGYVNSKKRYPVLYMHDGQNLFDEYTSGFGEWGIDECLDSLINKGKPGCIVIGIESGPKRINELNPYDNDQYGKAEGEEYLQFLVETLKPYIDKHYRTLISKENTFIAGSSLGGLISYFAMLRYPGIFGKAGMFSPSFWIAPEINDLTDSIGNKMKGMFFFYAGELESESMITDMKTVTDKLGENSSAFIYSVIDPDGKHNEASWRKWFEEFYLWISGNGVNYQIKTKD